MSGSLYLCSYVFVHVTTSSIDVFISETVLVKGGQFLFSVSVQIPSVAGAPYLSDNYNCRPITLRTRRAFYLSGHCPRPTPAGRTVLAERPRGDSGGLRGAAGRRSPVRSIDPSYGSATQKTYFEKLLRLQTLLPWNSFRRKRDRQRQTDRQIETNGQRDRWTERGQA